MASSLTTGISGLRVHQQMLDVVGNNLANSNTVGFKAQRTRFSDLMYQTLREAGASASTDVSGTNPVQVGMGVQLAAIDPNMQQGNLESTGQEFDFALQGDGFFITRNAGQRLFTRAGAFSVDSDNFLTDPSTGYRVQRFGGVGETNPTGPTFQTPGDNDIRIPMGTTIPARATTSIELQGNLSANAAGPTAQVVTTLQPFLAGGVAATGATLLNSLDDNSADYGGTDQLTITGTTAANTAVSATLAVGATTTLADLISAINANFPGSTASLDASGNIVLQSAAAGPSSLSLAIADAAGNTGATNWTAHAPTTTTAGTAGDTVRTGIQVFDVQGNPHSIGLLFQKQANNVWNLTDNIDPAEGTLTDNLVSGITFNPDGSLQGVTGTGLGNPTIAVQFTGFPAAQTITLDLGNPNTFSGVSQVGGGSSAAATNQDGYAAGSLTSVTVGLDGIINGIFTNGQTIALAQLAIASFANPPALDRVGNNYFNFTAESGQPLIGAATTGNRGQVRQKVLEASNVDVALEFSRLIIAQRGFQVNARTITASNEVLQELANILR
jgi:flagellar hook protein FlgE